MVKNYNLFKKLSERNQKTIEVTPGFRSELVGKINYKYAIIRIRRKLYVVESSETKNILRYFFFLFPFFPTKWKLMRISEEELAMIRYKPNKNRKKRKKPPKILMLSLFLGSRLEPIFYLGELSPETHLLLFILIILCSLTLALIVYFRSYPIKGGEFKENAVLCLRKNKAIEKEKNKVRFAVLGGFYLLLPCFIWLSFMVPTIFTLLTASLVLLLLSTIGVKNSYMLPTSFFGQKYEVEELGMVP